MNIYHTHITLNGKQFDASDCQDQLNHHLPEWEKEVFQFLVNWFDNSDAIQVTTSGSTGRPKTIFVKKSACIASAINTGEFFNFQAGQQALICLPAKYIAGKMMLVRAIVWQLNATIIPPKIELDIPQTSFDFTAMTPQQCAANIKTLNHLGNLIIGGAPVSPSLEEQIMAKTNTAYATYGMTETVSHIALRKLGETDYQTLPSIDISVDHNQCLQIKAPKLHDEPLQTTDVVALTSSTSFAWKGRADFVINSGGRKLHPEEIERKIASATGLNCLVFGQENEQWGQQPALIIEGAESVDLNKKLVAILHKHEMPVQTFYVNAFKRTENGKVQRANTIALIR